VRYSLPSVGGREDKSEDQSVSLIEFIFSADLGGSSNDLSEILKHRSGERFRRKGNPLRVSRT
jgi:hypothetical protein